MSFLENVITKFHGKSISEQWIFWSSSVWNIMDAKWSINTHMTTYLGFSHRSTGNPILIILMTQRTRADNNIHYLLFIAHIMQSTYRFSFRFEISCDNLCTKVYCLLLIAHCTTHIYFLSFENICIVNREQTKRTQIFESFAFASLKPIDRWVFGRRSPFNIHIYFMCVCVIKNAGEENFSRIQRIHAEMMKIKHALCERENNVDDHDDEENVNKKCKRREKKPFNQWK